MIYIYTQISKAFFSFLNFVSNQTKEHKLGRRKYQQSGVIHISYPQISKVFLCFLNFVSSQTNINWDEKNINNEVLFTFPIPHLASQLL